jgi:hypothetical protein
MCRSLENTRPTSAAKSIYSNDKSLYFRQLAARLEGRDEACRRAFADNQARYDGPLEFADMRLIAQGEISNVSNGG